MSLTPQLITPFATGLYSDIEPWLAPPDSFQEAVNVHVHHGYLQKRGGYRIFAQLQTLSTSVSISNIAQDPVGTVTTAAPHGLNSNDRVYVSGVGGMTQVNDLIFTITVTGASSFELGVDTTLFTAYSGGGTAQLLAAAATRVMGLFRRLQSDGSYSSLAFDTERAYLLNGVTKTYDPLDAAVIMSGGVNDYIWATNWEGSALANRLYFTNGVAFDGGTLNGIRYYDGSGLTTTLFTPALNAAGTRLLYGGKLLFVIKQRLVVLSTFENDGSTTSHPQRARWCQAQGPSNWDQETPGGGGFVDCPTGDQIISARALQDKIIVYFTDSVWTLSPVSDPALPFRWDKINDFRACFGKMASVGYDRVVKALGVRGITGTDGVATQRIDERIQDFVSDEINSNEARKVFCARDYANQRWWSLYPKIENDENSAALIFDDDSGAFTTYEIALNVLGYGNFEEDYALGDFTAANKLDLGWGDFNDEDFLSYFWQDDQELFLGGNTTGTVFVLETGGDDLGIAIDTSVVSADWAPYKEQGMEARMSYIDFFVDTDLETTGEVQFYKDNDESPYTAQRMNFLPDLGYIANIVNADQTNPVAIDAPFHGLTTGDVIYIYLVQGMTELNETNPYTVTVVNSDQITLDGLDGTGFAAYTNGGVIVQRPFYRTKTWKRIFAGGVGYQHHIRFTTEGSDRPYRIHAFKPSFSPIGKRTIN